MLFQAHQLNFFSHFLTKATQNSKNIKITQKNHHAKTANNLVFLLLSGSNLAIKT